MTTTEPWTIIRLLEWTSGYLSDHGADSPRLDAEVLLAEARGCKRIELYTAFDEVADDPLRTSFRDLVRRRAEGVPVAYLVGHREFYSLPFRVTPDVLIPRPETEQLVVCLLDLAKDYQTSGDRIRVADVGTGSGILGVCAAKHIAHCEVVALDLSSAALDIAKANAAHHEVSDRIEFLQSDLLATVVEYPPFDFVISNPPYVSEPEYAELSAEVKDHEPRLALVGGPQGTEIVQRLVGEAASALKPGGWFILEISPMIAEAVRGFIQSEPRFSGCEIKSDHAGHLRTVLTQRTNSPK